MTDHLDFPVVLMGLHPRRYGIQVGDHAVDPQFFERAPLESVAWALGISMEVAERLRDALSGDDWLNGTHCGPNGVFGGHRP